MAVKFSGYPDGLNTSMVVHHSLMLQALGRGMRDVCGPPGNACSEPRTEHCHQDPFEATVRVKGSGPPRVVWGLCAHMGCAMAALPWVVHTIQAWDGQVPRCL